MPSPIKPGTEDYGEKFWWDEGDQGNGQNLQVREHTNTHLERRVVEEASIPVPTLEFRSESMPKRDDKAPDVFKGFQVGHAGKGDHIDIYVEKDNMWCYNLTGPG